MFDISEVKSQNVMLQPGKLPGLLADLGRHNSFKLKLLFERFYPHLFTKLTRHLLLSTQYRPTTAVLQVTPSKPWVAG